MESQVEIKPILDGLRRQVDLKKLIPKKTGFPYPPNTNTPVEVQAFGLFLLEECRAGRGLRVSANSYNIKPAGASRAQDYINQAMTNYIRPFLDYVDQELRTHNGADATSLKLQGANSPASINSPTQDPRIVFVIHGRNEPLRKSMFEFLRAIGLNPLEWSQAVSATGESTPYIGQVLDAAFSRAQAVVVRMTPDDEACLRKEFQSEHDEQYERKPTGQARPNVLFEAGMSMGRHSKRTVLVQIGNLRPFSDVGGIHVLRLDNSSERRQDLADRLKTAGCPVDLGGRDWHKAGSFELNPQKA